ncbi:MAG TPA: septum site-determining protein MinC [Thermoflexia bacterium]|jgi:septum site-determining protein MinC|nr:septum site-determining protein MinC [Thermoflexia bacterium]
MDRGELVIKGIRQGLLITLGEGSWEDQLAQLERRLSQGATFFRGGRAALDVGDRRLGPAEIDQVCELLARYEVELWALLSPRDETALAAARKGLAVTLAQKEPEAPPLDEPVGALVVRRTLRSGQRIHHSGDVVVLGDVHAGAEIVAGGHVVVWGKLHGTVHAGAMGDEEAVVCALDLAPTQLRIAGYLARSPEERQSRPVPEVARVRDGKIEAVPWHQR